MKKWIVIPLVAALVMTTSGFLHGLESMTRESVNLANASKTAPRTSGEAAQEVDDLPEIAELTGEQAEAFHELADALQQSAERVATFNDSVAAQIEGVHEVADGIDDFDSPISCVRERLRELLDASSGAPPTIAEIESTMRELVGTQNRSIRHLRSINRKLTALGVVATATGVKSPPPPGRVPAPEASGTSSTRPC